MSVRKDDSVVLLTVDDGYAFAECRGGQKFRVAKARCEPDALVGARFGALFGVGKDGTLYPVSRRSLDPTAIAAGLAEGDASKNDNRHLDDDNKAQRLSGDSLRAMRSRGESGSAIIGALAAGSSTWVSKTEYSRTKWLKRKAKKYIPWAQILKPTAAVVAEAYFARKAGFSHACRPDVVAQVLARCNMRAGSRVLVADDFNHVVLAAVAERVGPAGKIVVLRAGPSSDDAVSRLNLPQKDMISHVDASNFQSQSFHAHALVIASSREPISILKIALPSLMPGCPVVVYSTHIEPLTRAFAWLQTSGNGVHAKLTEAWQREYQVAPNTTHPSMTMSHKAGYILSATKVLAPTPR